MHKKVSLSKSRLAVLAALIACAPASGCFPSPDFSATEAELHVRYMEAEDTLQLLEIQRGLVAGKPEEAADALQELMAGWRRFPPEGGLFSIDFDEEGPWIEEEEDESAEVRELWSRVQSLESEIQIDRAGLFLDDQDRLSFFRVTRIEGAAAVLEVVNDGINMGVRDEAKQLSEFQPEFPVFDRRTLELFGKAAEANYTWLRAEGGRIVLNAPMTEECAARCFSHLLRTAFGPKGPGVVELYSHIETMQVGDEKVELAFGPDATGWFHFPADPRDKDYQPRIREELEARGHLLDGAPSLAQVRAIMR